jgi:hypothetical protein
MAKVSGPLMSVQAHGSLGLVRFRRGRGGRVEVYHDGAPGSRNRTAPTARQAVVRARYSAIRASWGSLDPGERESWNAQAAAAPGAVSGWNLYLAAQMRGIDTDPAPALLLANGQPLVLEGEAGNLILEDDDA